MKMIMNMIINVIMIMIYDDRYDMVMMRMRMMNAGMTDDDFDLPKKEEDLPWDMNNLPKSPNEGLIRVEILKDPLSDHLGS